MIDTDFILENSNVCAMWCAAGCEPTDLAHAANTAIEQGVNTISVAPSAVAVIWPWLENKNIKILARFYLKSVNSETMSGITANINSVFKQGADGAQIFLNYNDMDVFVSQIYAIRDDLFFNKRLFIGFDITSVPPCDWNHVWDSMRRIRADGIIFAFTNDTGDDSNFVGQVYGAMKCTGNENKMSVHFAPMQMPGRSEQAARLITELCPEMVDKMKFFIKDNPRAQ